MCCETPELFSGPFISIGGGKDNDWIFILAFKSFPSEVWAPPPPSGQAMPNRMMPAGGNAQPMAPRHPGAPNGMCEFSQNAVFVLYRVWFCGVFTWSVSGTFSDPSSQPDGVAPAQPGPLASGHSWSDQETRHVPTPGLLQPAHTRKHVTLASMFRNNYEEPEVCITWVDTC